MNKLKLLFAYFFFPKPIRVLKVRVFLALWLMGTLYTFEGYAGSATNPKSISTHFVPSIKNQEADESILLKGQVLDEDGLTLAGATVQIKGTSVGTLTDADGQFTLEVPDGNTVLLISYVGYQAQEIAVGAQTNIVVTLHLSNEIQEIVVVGYGTQKKADLTGSVANVAKHLIQKK